MAQRRMFSPDIVSSDAFLDMPVSSQALYFHLAMNADDDGFVSPKKIMRLVGVSDDDLKVLLAKRFLLNFDGGVVVIKHWLIHNMIRKDRYKETRYIREKETLKVKDNGSYTELDKSWQPNGNQMAPQVRLGKVRLGEDSIDIAEASSASSRHFSPKGAEIIKAFEEIDPKNKTYYANKTQRASADFLITEYGFDKTMKLIAQLPKTNKMDYFPSVYSPSDLKEKWGKLVSAMQKYQSNQPLMI